MDTKLLFLCCILLLLTGAFAEKAKGTKRNPIRLIFGGNYPPYDYLVDTPGRFGALGGFGIEFAKHLCDDNGLSCEFIRHDYHECWTEADYPGRGLYGGGFDSCSTYTYTHLRRESLDFGHAYTLKQPGGILSRLDNTGNPVVSPESNLDGVKIALVGGWATDLASLGFIKNGCTDEKFSGYIPVTPDDPNAGPDAAMRALLAGEVDAVYIYADLLASRSDCAHKGCDADLYDPKNLGTKYAWIHTGIEEYQVNGTTLSMAPKGTGLNDILNPLMEDFMASKDYADLCEKYVDEGIRCFPNQYTKTIAVPLWATSDLQRTKTCDDNQSDACSSCSSGYCVCTSGK